MEDKMFEMMSKMYSEMQNGFKSVNSRLDKIELTQEEIKTKVSTLVELHEAHEQQQERLFKNNDSKVSEKIDILETAVKSISKDTKEIKESIDVLKEMTGKHEVDINILKRRPS